MATLVAPHIRLDDSGVAWIEGTAAKVIEVVRIKQGNGLSPDEVQAELPHLSLSQVYAALAYYYDHQEELNTEIARRDQWVDEMRLQAENQPTRQEMLARNSGPSADSAIG